MVNPPGSPKSRFRTSQPGVNPAAPEDFLAAAAEAPGSWWPDYSAWLGARSGPRVPAPVRLGSADFPVLCAAPGTYVHDR
jgi:polyhydroxyalkanoate synthase